MKALLLTAALTLVALPAAAQDLRELGPDLCFFLRQEAEVMIDSKYRGLNFIEAVAETLEFNEADIASPIGRQLTLIGQQVYTIEVQGLEGLPDWEAIEREKAVIGASVLQGCFIYLKDKGV